MSNDDVRLGGPRPDGVPGLLIDEIELRGIYRTPKGHLAQVSSDRKNYLLKEGDQLWDGDVILVSRDEVVFKQILAEGKFREVVKALVA